MDADADWTVKVYTRRRPGKATLKLLSTSTLRTFASGALFWDIVDCAANEAAVRYSMRVYSCRRTPDLRLVEILLVADP